MDQEFSPAKKLQRLLKAFRCASLTTAMLAPLLSLPIHAQSFGANVLSAGSFDETAPKYVPWAGVDDLGNLHGIDGKQISVDDAGKIQVDGGGGAAPPILLPALPQSISMATAKTILSLPTALVSSGFIPIAGHHPSRFSPRAKSFRSGSPRKETTTLQRALIMSFPAFSSSISTVPTSSTSSPAPTRENSFASPMSEPQRRPNSIPRRTAMP